MNTSDLEKCLEMAEEGRKLWLSYDGKYHFNGQRVPILMPSEGKDYHEELLNNMDEMIRTRKLTNAVFLIEESEVVELASEWKKQSDRECEVVIEPILREDVEKLYKLNAMYAFSRYLIIDAFEKVQDMDAASLIGVRGITKRDIVRTAMLGLPD